MVITTKKTANGMYAVFVNGKATSLVIAKGDAPKYRMPQLWCIGVSPEADQHPYWIIGDQTGKAAAEATIAEILKACQI